MAFLFQTIFIILFPFQRTLSLFVEFLNEGVIIMNKYIKIGIAVVALLLTGVAILIQLNTPNANVRTEAQKAFNILETAFKEDRELTKYELMELRKFERLRNDRVEKYNNDKASKKEKEDAILLYAVGQVVDLYKVDMNQEEFELFQEKYNTAKILLE